MTFFMSGYHLSRANAGVLFDTTVAPASGVSDTSGQSPNYDQVGRLFWSQKLSARHAAPLKDACFTHDLICQPPRPT